MECQMIVKHVISAAATGKKNTRAKLIHKEMNQFPRDRRGCARTHLNAPLDYSQSQLPPAPFWISDLKSEQMLTVSLFTATRSENVYFSGHSSYAVVSMIRYAQRSETMIQTGQIRERHPSLMADEFIYAGRAFR